jgi:hypothetical protein
VLPTTRRYWASIEGPTTRTILLCKIPTKGPSTGSEFFFFHPYSPFAAWDWWKKSIMIEIYTFHRMHFSYINGISTSSKVTFGGNVGLERWKEKEE